MALQFVVTETNLAQKYPAQMAGVLGGMRRAAMQASQATAKTIQQKGAADIAKSGRFGSRWQQGLIVTAEGAGIENRIIVAHTMKGAELFEYGGQVRGKPLLWIPLSFADPKARARNYPGGLFRVDRRGKPPLLFSAVDKRPKFVGVRQVRIPKKWHLRDISAKSFAEDWPKHYNRSFTVSNG